MINTKDYQRLASYWITGVCLLFMLSGQSLYATETIRVTQSQNDEREYRYLRLDNELQVLLISDPETDKAAASLDVNVGSGDDPDEWPGLAHFLEHMLFLGTEKYPEAGDYQAFINAHGGNHNAYTSLEHTNYFFDVDAGYLEPTLDRFSQFFVAPVLDAEYVDRERNAVHSEYKARYKNEFRRSWDVYREITNPANKSVRFGVGSLETLADKEEQTVREALLDFYVANYSANIMALTVLGKEDLDTLEKMVRTRFEAVKNNKVVLSREEVPLFVEGALPKKVYIRSLKEQRRLSLIFPIPVYEQYYREKPLRYIGFMLGHEGRNSLYYALRDKGWIESLSAGPGISNRQSASFHISIELTRQGYQHRDEIIAMSYQAIERLKKDGIERWRYNEQSVIGSLGFRYQEKGDAINYVSSLSNNMHYYESTDIVSGGYLMEKFDEKLIRYYLDYLRPDNMLLDIRSRDVPTNRVATYYETEYSVAEVTGAELTSWQKEKLNDSILSPNPNEFVAKQFKVKRVEKSHKEIPELIRSSKNLSLWHQQDKEFSVPKGGIYIYARSVDSVKSAKGAALTQLFVNLLNHDLNEYSYPASLAGLDLNLTARARGIGIEINGYNDKQGLLLKRVIDAMISPAFRQKDFENIKQEMLKDLANESKRMPFRQLFAEMPAVMVRDNQDRETYRKVVENIELKQVQEFALSWLRGVTVEMLIHGNFSRSDALKLSSIVDNKFKLSGRLRHDPQSQVLIVPAQRNPWAYIVETDHQDNALLKYIQANDDSLRSQALMRLLVQVSNSEFYTQLRTQQQLGYVVYAGYRPVVRTPGIGFVVQSPVYSTTDIDSSMLSFVLEFEKILIEMPDEAFAKHKSALINRLSEKPKSLGEKGGRFWGEINLGYTDFTRRELLIAIIEKLDKQALVNFYLNTMYAPTKREMNFIAVPHDREPVKDEKLLSTPYSTIKNLPVFKQQQKYHLLK